MKRVGTEDPRVVSNSPICIDCGSSEAIVMSLLILPERAMSVSMTVQQQGPVSLMWLTLPLENMGDSPGQVATRDHVDTQGLCIAITIPALHWMQASGEVA